MNRPKFNTIIVQWTRSDKCRLPSDLEGSLNVQYEGKEVELCVALSKEIRELLTEWKALRGRSFEEIATSALDAKNRRCERAYQIFLECITANSKSERLVVEATSLKANFIRTIDVLLEALLDFRRQGRLGGGATIEATLDISVAGFYRYSQYTHPSLGKDTRSIPYVCASKGVTEKALANVFRSTEEYVSKVSDHAKDFLRSNLSRELLN